MLKRPNLFFLIACCSEKGNRNEASKVHSVHSHWFTIMLYARKLFYCKKTIFEVQISIRTSQSSLILIFIYLFNKTKRKQKKYIFKTLKKLMHKIASQPICLHICRLWRFYAYFSIFMLHKIRSLVITIVLSVHR